MGQQQNVVDERVRTHRARSIRGDDAHFALHQLFNGIVQEIEEIVDGRDDAALFGHDETRLESGGPDQHLFQLGVWDVGYAGHNGVVLLREGEHPLRQAGIAVEPFQELVVGSDAVELHVLEFELLGHGVDQVIFRNDPGPCEHLAQFFLGHPLDLQGVANMLVADIPFVPEQIAYANGSGHVVHL